jgi:hypothetical protein
MSLFPQNILFLVTNVTMVENLLYRLATLSASLKDLIYLI